MHTLVSREIAVGCSTEIAFIAGAWMLTGMRALVYSEIAARCTSIVAFVAREWTLSRKFALVSNEMIVGPSVCACARSD